MLLVLQLHATFDAASMTFLPTVLNIINAQEKNLNSK